MNPTRREYLLSMAAAGGALGGLYLLLAMMWRQPTPPQLPPSTTPWLTATPGIVSDTNSGAPPVVIGWLND